MSQATEPATEWHQEQRTILGALTLEVGQTRNGEFWIAPLGTPAPTSYPPDGAWCYLGGGPAVIDATEDLLDQAQLIAIHPGDTVIFQAPRPITNEEGDELRARLVKLIDPEFRFLIVGADWTIRVLQPTE